MDDIIDDMHYDAKHSFEDNIVAVEKAYELWGDRIAILGGIDLDFLCTKSLNEIRKRAENLIAITDNKGYALGSGNSIPPYVPDENFHAMREVALK
jgi:uroporphyrinogen decarboxylase